MPITLHQYWIPWLGFFFTTFTFSHVKSTTTSSFQREKKGKEKFNWKYKVDKIVFQNYTSVNLKQLCLVKHGFNFSFVKNHFSTSQNGNKCNNKCSYSLCLNDEPYIAEHSWIWKHCLGQMTFLYTNKEAHLQKHFFFFLR